MPKKVPWTAIVLITACSAMLGGCTAGRPVTPRTDGVAEVPAATVSRITTEVLIPEFGDTVRDVRATKDSSTTIDVGFRLKTGGVQITVRLRDDGELVAVAPQYLPSTIGITRAEHMAIASCLTSATHSDTFAGALRLSDRGVQTITTAGRRLSAKRCFVATTDPHLTVNLPNAGDVTYLIYLADGASGAEFLGRFDPRGLPSDDSALVEQEVRHALGASVASVSVVPTDTALQTTSDDAGSASEYAYYVWGYDLGVSYVGSPVELRTVLSNAGQADPSRYALWIYPGSNDMDAKGMLALLGAYESGTHQSTLQSISAIEWPEIMIGGTPTSTAGCLALSPDPEAPDGSSSQRVFVVRMRKGVATYLGPLQLP